MGARWPHTRSPAASSFSPPLALRDCLLAAALFLAFELPSGSNPYEPVNSLPSLAWVCVGAVMTVAVALRRLYPVGVWMISTGSAAFLLTVVSRFNPLAAVPGMLASPLVVLPAPLVVLYTMARSNHACGRLALAVSLVAMEPALLVTVTWTPSLGPAGSLALDHPQRGVPLQVALVVAGMLITAWALGETMRTRDESARVRMAAAKAAEAEHDRAVAGEERARIARELHDITAHHISVVTLQAGAARLLAESGRPPSAELLRGIETSSRQAMTEIRQALGVIRSSPDGAAPLPGLARLPELAAQMGLAGLTVTIDGRGGSLPGSLDLTAYRIVQEGLANVARHSASHQALVTLRRINGELRIAVADDGPSRRGSAAGPGGNGLIGLRERVTRYGGRLQAGARRGGGFELLATLPVREAAADRPPGGPLAPASREQAAMVGPASGRPTAEHRPVTALP